MRGLAAFALATGLVVTGAATAARAAPDEVLHAMPFKIHTDLVTAEQDLDFWRAELAEALVVATNALQGSQGPFDTPCCTRIESDPALVEFGASGDGHDVVLDSTDFEAIRDTFGPGAYLVRAIDFCGLGGSTSIVGCADRPGEYLVVEVDVSDTGAVLGLGVQKGITIAHERGHNAGLGHPTNDPCELMAVSNSGGCLTSAACDSFLSKSGTLAGAPCECLSAAKGPALADGSVCSDPSGAGLCSGGLCGAAMSEAGARAWASGYPEGDAEMRADDALALSGLTGGWEDRGEVGAELRGMAYDPSRDVVFGVGPQAGANDRLVAVDPGTGQLASTVGELDRTRVEALAYDSDADRLLAIEIGETLFGNPAACEERGLTDCISTLLVIDPETAAVTELGPLSQFIIQGGVPGLAYDPATGTLFGSSAGGLVTIDPSACDGSECPDTGPIMSRVVTRSALTWDPFSRNLLRAALDQGTRPVYQTFDTGTGSAADATTGAPLLSMGIDGIDAHGLAAVPVPEPAVWMLRLAGLASIAVLAALAAMRGRLGVGRRSRSGHSGDRVRRQIPSGCSSPRTNR